LLVAAACSGSSTAAPPPRSSPAQTVTACVGPQAAQFDFWIGSWRGAWTDGVGPETAIDVVVRNGCELDETFTAAHFLHTTGYSATSKSRWDSALGKWIQDYSDNAGERSRWLGGFADGAMTLVGPQTGTRAQKVVWRNIEANSWAWDYDSSTDGTTWSPLVTIQYVRG
jgi:hypothetical protein